MDDCLFAMSLQRLKAGEQHTSRKHPLQIWLHFLAPFHVWSRLVSLPSVLVINLNRGQDRFLRFMTIPHNSHEPQRKVLPSGADETS